jgi:hypothetical protein
MRFVLSDQLIGHLRDAQETRGYSDEIAESEDAFLLDPGLGAPAYLTYDGRVLLDFPSWDGTPLREADDHEAFQAIIAGAAKMGVPELLELLPKPPAGAKPCPRCQGEKRIQVFPNQSARMICPHCSGLGWLR